MVKYKYFYLLLFVLFFSCSKTQAPLDVVDKVDLQKYAGKWYEIARFPHSFENHLKCVTADYTIRDDGKITVLNKGHKKEAPVEVEKAEGVAWIPVKSEPGKLKVSFFWPFAGKYWIIHLDEEDYQYSLVGSPSRKYLWILSRSKKIDEDIYNKLKEIAKEKLFDVNKLEKIEQNCK